MSSTRHTEALTKLERIVATVEHDLRGRDPEGLGIQVAPELMRDSSGRYILLDAYTALVMGYAAIDAHS